MKAITVLCLFFIFINMDGTVTADYEIGSGISPTESSGISPKGDYKDSNDHKNVPIWDPEGSSGIGPTEVVDAHKGSDCSSEDGEWGYPGECVRKSIIDAKSKLSQIARNGGDFGSALEEFANATKQNLTAEEMSETIDVLNIALNITNNSEQVSKKEVKGFVDIVSNLMGKDSATNWESLQKKDKVTAASMLKIIEDFGRIASQKINKSLVVSSENLVLELQKVDGNENVLFPSANHKHQKWVQESNTNVFVPSEIFKNAFEDKESITMNAVLFKNMKDILPKSRNNDSIKSYVMGVSFGKPLVNLTKNISLTFLRLSEKGFTNPSCNFWNFQMNPEMGGSWSTEGCVVQSSNSTHTTCSCNHLTNFAILMKFVQDGNRKILDIISIIGCNISIVSLIATVIVYGICWKHITVRDVSKSQAVLLMNLCTSLVMGYLIFLSLVKKTEDKDACTATAALIHFFFLVSFFTMLAEGIDMTIALTRIFPSTFNRLPLLLGLSWGGPTIIVIITLAATKTKGFGDELFCWLTSENHANLAFLIPVLIIITINIICVILIVKALLSANCMLRESIKQRLRTGARAIGILMPLLGLGWVFGVLAINGDLVAFEYIFVIINSLQGFFIFLAYCIFNQQVRKNLWIRGRTLSQSCAQCFTSNVVSKLSNFSNEAPSTVASVGESSV